MRTIPTHILTFPGPCPCLSVCLCVAHNRELCKTDTQIEMPFEEEAEGELVWAQSITQGCTLALYDEYDGSIWICAVATMRAVATSL